MTLYVDAGGKLPLGWDQVFGGVKVSYRYKGLRIVAPVDNSTFAWKPPPGVTERASSRGTQRMHRPEPTLRPSTLGV